METSSGESEPAAASLPSAFSLFKPSWQALLRNLFTFFYLPVMPLIVAVCGGVIALSTAHTRTHGLFVIIGLVVVAISVVLFLIAMAAMVYTQLQSVRGAVVSYYEALERGRYFFWRLWGLWLLLSVLYLVGFLLFIVPGIFLMKRYLLASYILVAKDTGIRKAMRDSAALSTKYSGGVWGVVGVQLLIGIPNLVPFLGAIASSVLSILYYCVPAVRYVEIDELEAEELARAKEKKAAEKAAAKALADKEAKKTAKSSKRSSSSKKD